MKRKPHLWIELTIAEAIPVLESHINFNGGGPFYEPNFKCYFSPEEREYAERCAEAQRAKGRTVTVRDVVR